MRRDARSARSIRRARRARGGCARKKARRAPRARRTRHARRLPPRPARARQVGISDAPTSGEVDGATADERVGGAGVRRRPRRIQGRRSRGARRRSFNARRQADSKAFQAYYSLGVVEERLNEISNAVSSYRQATVIVPDYEPAIAAYAVCSRKSGKPDQAVDYLNGRMAAMPKSAAVSAAMAEVKSIQGDSGAAQRLAQEALKKNPDYSPAMITLARDHYRARRLDLALYTLKAILDGDGPENPPRDKNNAEARLLRGLILKEQGNRPAAIDEFEKSIALRPDLVEARVHLAAYYLESGNATGAAPLLENAVRYDNDHVLAHLNLGDAYRLLGKTAEARRELEWVQKKDPQLAQVHYNLGLLYLFSDAVPGMTPAQATEAAIAELEQYKKMRPRQAGSNDDTDELITRAKAKKGDSRSRSGGERAPRQHPQRRSRAAPATGTKDSGGMTATPPAAPKK